MEMRKKGSTLKELFLTLPSYLWLLLFFLIPTILVFTYAFGPQAEVNGHEPQGIARVISKVLTPSTLAIFWQTFWLSAITTLVSLSLALPAGYYIIQKSQKVQKLFLLLIIMPFWSSFLVRIFAWKSLLHPEGTLKALLVSLHIIDSNTSLLYNSGAVLIVMIYSYLPFAILPIYAASQKFNFQLIEAAVDLGASRLYAFFKVFIPSIREGIFTALLMVFIPALGAYVIPDIVGGPHTEMVGNKIAQRILLERNLPQGALLSAILFLAVLIPMAISAFVHLKSPAEDAIQSKKKRAK